jgi:hypothetical protein
MFITVKPLQGYTVLKTMRNKKIIYYILRRIVKIQTTILKQCLETSAETFVLFTK